MSVVYLLLWIPYMGIVCSATTTPFPTGPMVVIIGGTVNPTPPGPPSDLDIFPSSYLPGVSRTVQLTCRPPANGEGNKLLLLQLDKVESGSRTPVATALSGQTAVVERKGTLLHASASVDYNSDPLLSTLRVDLQDPKEDAAGDYLCIAETMDGHGELHQYMATATLTSLGRGGAVPAFYRTVLLELRADLDNMTVGLDSVINAQRDVRNTWGPATEAKLSAVNKKASLLNGLIADINTYVSDVTLKEKSIRTELDRLRSMTPDTKVYFYAYLSSSSIGPGNNANIVFNVLERKTDTSYSTSTGIFTCPHNGTYFFRAGITASGQRAYASIMADDEIVASLYAYDDYSFQSSMASAIVNLVEGDQVKVVQTSGSTANVYGYSTSLASVNHVSFFMGMLLW